MKPQNGAMNIIGSFLSDFYYNQPDDTLAQIKALRALNKRYAYEWQVASAFRSVLENGHLNESDTFTEFVSKSANRYVEDEKEAARFLWQVYNDTSLDVAFDPELLTE